MPAGTGLFRAKRSSAQVATNTAAASAQMPTRLPDCPLACRIPKVAKSGDWAEDAQRESMRDAMVELINIVWWEQEHVTTLVGYARKLRERALQDRDVFPTHPNVFQHVPRDFLARWIASQGEDGCFDADWLDRMNCEDDTFIHNFASLLCALPLSLSVPKVLSNCMLMQRFLDTCAARVQRSAKLKKFVSADGYNKQAGGAYSLLFEEGRCTKVRHIDGEETICPAFVYIDDTFELTSWACERSCAAKKKPSEVVLHKLFDAGAGPNKSILNKRNVDAIVAELSQNHEAEVEQRKKANAVASNSPDTILAKSAKKKTDQMAAKAKETLVRHKEKMHKAKTIALK